MFFSPIVCASTKQKQHRNLSAALLSYLDSNQDKLIQSQMCYRYTIGQSLSFS